MFSCQALHSNIGQTFANTTDSVFLSRMISFSLQWSIVQTFASAMDQCCLVRTIFFSVQFSIVQTFSSTMEQCSLVRTISFFSSCQHCPTICKLYGTMFSCQDNPYFSHSSIVLQFASSMEQCSPVRIIHISLIPALSYNLQALWNNVLLSG